jgi:hypothetical protein
MIEIVDAYTRSGNEWCTCCQKQTDTKRIKFSYDGRQGNSVVLCDDCRRELARTIQAIPLDKIRAEIEKTTSRYTISRERGAMGQVEWSDRLIKESEVLEIIDKYKAESENKE